MVLPNNDTAYALASLDLSREPLVLHLPDTGGRYDVFQLLDAYTNVFANPGRRLNGTAAQDVAITGPGWTGTLPPGVRRVASPTPHAWLLGRVLVDGPSDLPAVRALLARFTLNPLSAHGTPGASTSSIVLTSFPSLARPQVPRGQAFLDALAAALAADPPPARDAPLLRRLARYGIRPGRGRARLGGRAPGPGRRGAAGGRRARARQPLVGARPPGWLVPPRRTGRFGTDYELRAITARYALGANVAEETVYGLAFQDSAGRPLSGAHRYRVRFAPGQLPPVRAFWSLTMYGSNLFLVDNPLGGATRWATARPASGAPATAR